MLVRVSLRTPRGCLRSGVASALHVPHVAHLPASPRRAAPLSSAPAPLVSSVIPGDHMKEGTGLPAGAKAFTLTAPFPLENGGALPGVTVAYSTFGALNAGGTNAVVVGHSLTSNSCVDEWWGPLMGDGPQFLLDTSKYFVVCCNYLGSVYGSTGPLHVDPRSGIPFSADFPVTTLRDNVRAQKLVLDSLGVTRVSMAAGGSLGGMLAMEWALTHPTLVDTLLLIACPPVHTDWAIGWGEVGRQAVYADPKWWEGRYPVEDPPMAGMAVARQAAMLSYRTPFSLSDKFRRSEHAGGRGPDERRAQGQGALCAAPLPPVTPPPYYEVERYLNYQGAKFVSRFDPLSYVRLTQLLDTHDVARGRGGDYRTVLSGITQRTMVVGIDSDLLYPLDLQREMARLIPDASLFVVHTPHGHDGFLIEIDELNRACAAWVRGEAHPGVVRGGGPAGAAVQPGAAHETAAQRHAGGGGGPPKRKIKLG